jgi:hypothetical protein
MEKLLYHLASGSGEKKKNPWKLKKQKECTSRKATSVLRFL